jgi:orotidine-5'-phosphate decarboxylase
MGRESLLPFINQNEKGIIVLCRTSNKGSGEFQNMLVDIPTPEANFLLNKGVSLVGAGDGGSLTNLYKHVAYQVSQKWNTNGNCAVVVGATTPDELAVVRKIVGDMPILIPGIGAQGGDIEKTVKAGKDSRGKGMIINSSRGIIFASSGEDFAEEARRETQKLHDEIRKHLN